MKIFLSLITKIPDMTEQDSQKNYGVAPEEFDKAQIAAIYALNDLHNLGFIPGLNGLVNELSRRATSKKQLETIIADWLTGDHVYLDDPVINYNEDQC
jgi:hypothetical protein